MKISLKSIVVPSIPLATLSVGICFVLWMSAYVGSRFTHMPEANTPIAFFIQSVFTPNSLLSYLVSFAFTFLNAFLLTHLNNRFTLIRSRTFLPILIFLLLLGSWHETHSQVDSHLTLSLFILSLNFFLSIYRDTKASEEAFMAAFLVSVSSLIINQLIFVIFLFWLGLIMFQSFSLRTFLATIFGALVPWILYLAVHYFYNPESNLNELLVYRFDIANLLSTLAWSTLIYISTLGVVLFICIGGMYSNFHSDAIHTRIKLNFVLLLLVGFLIVSYLYTSHAIAFLPYVALTFSVIASHPFTLKQNNFFGILFIVFCVLNLAYIVSKYFPY